MDRLHLAIASCLLFGLQGAEMVLRCVRQRWRGCCFSIRLAVGCEISASLCRLLFCSFGPGRGFSSRADLDRVATGCISWHSAVCRVVVFDMFYSFFLDAYWKRSRRVSPNEKALVHRSLRWVALKFFRIVCARRVKLLPRLGVKLLE